MFKVNKNLRVKIIKNYLIIKNCSESELDSNFAINSMSDFNSEYEYLILPLIQCQIMNMNLNLILVQSL